MRRELKVSLLLCVLLSCVASQAEKDHAWQTGTVLDTARNRYFAGTVHNGSEQGTINTTSTDSSTSGHYSGSNSGSDVAVYRVYENYVIDTGTMVYLVEERLHWKWSKGAHLTVNGPVKFYLDKRKMHILDDDGKDHETSIVKQTLKKQ